MLRTPLSPRSGRIRWVPELMPYARGNIVGAAGLGRTPAEIAAPKTRRFPQLRARYNSTYNVPKERRSLDLASQNLY